MHDVHSSKVFAFWFKTTKLHSVFQFMKMRFASKKTIFIRVKLCVAMYDAHSSNVFAFCFKTTKLYSVSQFMKMRFVSKKNDFYTCRIVCCHARCSF
jgi:hypothetical protein